ncbi:MAG: cysteine hydrolase [Thermodesulfovibrionales bacterium]
MKAHEVAIILTGFQNEFCAPDGKLHGLVKDMLVSNRIIPNTVDFLKRAQKKGIACYIASIVFTQGYPELNNPVGILKDIKKINAFQKGTKGADVIDELKPFEHYLTVVEGKTGLSCFGNTNLDNFLKDKAIRTIAIAGLLTNVCVESTARAGYDVGYEVIVLRDCTACRSRVWQEYSEKNIFPMFGRVMDHNDFLDEIE